MNLVELENVSGPRVRQGARLKKTRSNRTTTHDCSRRSADAEIGVRGTRGTRLFFWKVTSGVHRNSRRRIYTPSARQFGAKRRQPGIPGGGHSKSTICTRAITPACPSTT